MQYNEYLYNQYEHLMKQFPEGLRFTLIAADHITYGFHKNALDGCTYTFDYASADDVTTLYKLAADYKFTLTFQERFNLNHAVFSYNRYTVSKLDKDTVKMYLKIITKELIDDGVMDVKHINEHASKILPLNKLPNYMDIIKETRTEYLRETGRIFVPKEH